MNDYGVLVKNADGDVVYDSRKKTLRVIASGTVVISDTSRIYTITFPPQTERPEGFFTNGGCFSNLMTYSVSPIMGQFKKDAQGRWVSCDIMCKSVGFGGGGYTVPSLPWRIPYVIFI